MVGGWVGGGIEIKATHPSWGWKLGLSLARTIFEGFFEFFKINALGPTLPPTLMANRGKHI